MANWNDYRRLRLASVTGSTLRDSELDRLPPRDESVERQLVEVGRLLAARRATRNS